MISRQLFAELRTTVLRHQGGDKFRVFPGSSHESTALAAWSPHSDAELILFTYDRGSWLALSDSIRSFLEANQLAWQEKFLSVEACRRKSWGFVICPISATWHKPAPVTVCRSTDPRVGVDFGTPIQLLDADATWSETEDGITVWCSTLIVVDELRRRFLDCKRSFEQLANGLYEYSIVFPDRVTDATKHLDVDDTSSVLDAVREQALRSSLWQWVPGMAWVHPDGRRGRVEVGVPPIPDALPELLDSGTRGCLLDLIRYQCGESRLCVIHIDKPSRWRVGFVGDSWVRFEDADSEIGALMVALTKPPTKMIFYAL